MDHIIVSAEIILRKSQLIYGRILKRKNLGSQMKKLINGMMQRQIEKKLGVKTVLIKEKEMK